MTNANSHNGSQSHQNRQTTHLVPVPSGGNGRSQNRGQSSNQGSASGSTASGGAGNWRPAAPFLAQMIGERETENRLSRARRNLPTIFNAYGKAANTSQPAGQQLDLSA